MTEAQPSRKLVTTRRVLLLLVVAVSVGLGWLFRDRLARLFHVSHVEVTEAAFEQIQRGMTRAEVEAILGGPPGDYADWQCSYGITNCTASTCLLFDDWRYGGKAKKPEEVTPVSPGGTMALWAGTEYAIGIEFDSEGRVVYTGLGRAMPEPTILDHAREWLGW